MDRRSLFKLLTAFLLPSLPEPTPSHMLSTDFLELPKSLRERRALYRHFYNNPIVGPMIDLHTEYPLSAIRL